MTEPWPGLEIRHLLALIAVAEEASFSRAAERLGYTQSAVSQQIARLERIVGTELVERPGGPRPVRPTEAGEAVLAHARTVLAQVRAAEAEVLAVVAGDGGRVRVGTVQSVGTKILPEVLRIFRGLRPGVVVELEEAHDPALLLERLAAGQLDLAFCEEPMPPGRWGTRHVLDDPFILLAPAGSAEAARRSLSIDEIGELPLIGYRNPSCMGLMVAAFEGTPNIPNFVFHSDDNGTIQGCVGAGLAHALVFLLTVDEADPSTVVVPVEPQLAPRRINIAWPGDRPLSNAQAAFVEVVAEVCGRIAEPRAAAA
ncbi:MAG: LysR family transcriptional regulator [Acidimicrobiia bacterium]|nr:LysR family transcriptional regulator [Acidimicrobiia bacterium]